MNKYLALLMLVVVGSTQAAIVEFIPPNDPTGGVLTTNSNDGWSSGRGVVFQATQTTNIDSIGLYHNLTGIALSYQVSEAVTASGDVASGETILASGSTSVTTSGLEWIDFPVGPITLSAGGIYHVEFTFSGNGNQNFFYSNANVVFSQDGFDVIDGTAGGDTSNSVMPAIRLNTLGLVFTFVESSGDILMQPSGSIDTALLQPADSVGWGGVGVEANTAPQSDIMGDTSAASTDTGFAFSPGTDFSAWETDVGPWTSSNFSWVSTVTTPFSTYVINSSSERDPGLQVRASDLVDGVFTPSGSWTAIGVTFADIGMVPGTYTVTDAETGASITYQIGGQLVAEPDLTISKTDDADPVAAGTNVTYTVRVDNAGTGVADDVVVTDTLPAGVTLVSTTGCTEDPAGVPSCSLGSIDAGSFAEFMVTVTVDPAVTGLITNNVSVATSSDESNTDNNSASEDTTVFAEADLSITKIDNSDPVVSGTGPTLVYTIEVSNAGPSDATNVVVTDILPEAANFVSTDGCLNDPDGVPDCQLGTIAAGALASYDITVALNPAGGTIVNQVSVSSDASDPNGDNDSVFETTDVEPIVIPALGIEGLGLLILLLAGFGWVAVRRI